MEASAPSHPHPQAPVPAQAPGSAFAPILAGLGAALGASVCCVGPLALVVLGLGGAWAANLRILEPLYPLLLAVAVGGFGFAFWRLYVSPRRCAPEAACAAAPVVRRQRIAFWVAVVAAKALLLFPLYGAYLLA